MMEKQQLQQRQSTITPLCLLMKCIISSVQIPRQHSKLPQLYPPGKKYIKNLWRQTAGRNCHKKKKKGTNTTVKLHIHFP